MIARSVNEAFCQTLVDEFVAQGLRHVVVCPGSRSTPMAVALADRNELDLSVIVDERSAAFVALGLAKASRRPALILCTSGTAGAHFLPALIEASLTEVPIVVVTADRPPELHGFGALQSIDQTRLFGAFATFVDLGVPDASSSTLTHLRAVVARAMASRCVTHLNAPFREPLAPIDEGLAIETHATHARRQTRAVRAAEAAVVAEVAARLDAAARPVIVVGPVVDVDAAAAVAALAEHAGVPLFAELASGARGCAVSIDFAELQARSGFEPAPDLVVRFGGGATTRVLQSFVDSAADLVVVGFVDANHKAALVVDADADAFARAVSQAMPKKTASPWLQSLQARDRVVDAAVAASIEGASVVDEPGVARTVVKSLRAHSALLLASSMPIRDAETFGGSVAEDVVVVVNRGACGIDGLISTAVGFERGSGRPVTVLIGDLALTHDLHGLICARGHNVVVVVVNNDGGGIFSFLPVAAHPRFEQLFGTPHGLSFEHAARFVGASYEAPASLSELRRAIDGAHARGGLAVVEVRTDRATNKAAHERVHAAVAAALRSAS